MTGIMKFRICFEGPNNTREGGFYEFTGDDISKTSKDLILKACQMIRKQYNDDYHLYIYSQTPKHRSFRFEIPHYASPDQFSDRLCFFPNLPEQKQQYNDTFLIISNITSESFFTIPVFAASNLDKMFNFPFHTQIPLQLRNIRIQIANSLQIASQDLTDELCEFWNIQGKIDGKYFYENQMDVIRQIMNGQIFIKLDTESPKILSQIKTLTNSIHCLVNHIKNTTNLRIEDKSMAFEFQKINQSHNNLIEKLKKVQIDYMFSFVEDLRETLALQNYISAFFVVQKKQLHAVCSPDLLDVCSVISHIVLTYHSLLKTIFDNTPALHPYYPQITALFQEINVVRKKISNFSILIQSETYCKDIIAKFLSHGLDKTFLAYSMDKERISPSSVTFLSSYLVYYKIVFQQGTTTSCSYNNDKLEICLLILLSNGIILAKPNGTHFEMSAYFSINCHGFHIYQKNGVFFSHYRTPDNCQSIFQTVLIIFPNENERNEFFNLHRQEVVKHHCSKASYTLPAPNKTQFSTTIRVQSVSLKKQLYLTHHALVCTGNDKLYLFGGIDENGNPQNLFREINLTQRKVKHAKPQNISARYDSLMVNRGQSLYVFGGTPDGINQFNDLWQFSLTDTTFDATQLATKSSIHPSPSDGYTMTFFDDDTIILIGGSSEFNIYHYSIQQDQWIEREHQGVHLESLCGHQSVQIDSEHILIFGGKIKSNVYNNGVLIYEPKTGNLSVLRTTGIYPFNRINHHAIPLNKHLVIVFGGETEKMPTNEESNKYVECFSSINNEETSIYLLNLITGEWSFTYLFNPDFNNAYLSIRDGAIAYCIQPNQSISTIYFYNGIIQGTTYLTNVIKMKMMASNDLPSSQSDHSHSRSNESNQPIILHSNLKGQDLFYQKLLISNNTKIYNPPPINIYKNPYPRYNIGK